MQVLWALRANSNETTRSKNCIENCVVLVKLSDTAALPSALIRACMGPGSQHLVSSSHHGRIILRRKPPLFTLHRDGTPQADSGNGRDHASSRQEKQEVYGAFHPHRGRNGAAGPAQEQEERGEGKKTAGGRAAGGTTARRAHAAAAKQPAELS